MTTLETTQWRDLNDRTITMAVAWVRALLRERSLRSAQEAPAPPRRGGLFSWFTSSPPQENPAAPEIAAGEALSRWKESDAQLETAGGASTLVQLARRFSLTAFEQNIVLLCLAFELD